MVFICLMTICILIVAAVGLGVAAWYCWPYPPSLVHKKTDISTFQIILNASTPVFILSGEMTYEANYTGRVDISVDLAKMNVTHRGDILGTIEMNPVGTIVAQKSTLLTIAYTIRPANPDSVVLQLMMTEIALTGTATIKFEGFANLVYIGYNYVYALSFSQNLRLTA